MLADGLPDELIILMAFRQLHSYPKVFNDQGNLKAFPFRSPLRVSFKHTFWISMGLYFLVEEYREWTFSQYCHSQFFQQDVPSSPFRKPNYCCENEPLIL
jgi:hypothetical protein